MGRLVKKKFRTPLYGIGFTIVIYEERDDLVRLFRNTDFMKEYKLSEDLYDGWVYEIDDHLYCVFYAREERCPTPGTIAHEAKHLVNNIFIKVHHTLSRYNDEPEAYLLGWVVSRIHELKDKFGKLEK